MPCIVIKIAVHVITKKKEMLDESNYFSNNCIIIDVNKFMNSPSTFIKSLK